VLVCGAELFVATLHNLRSIDPGFAADHLMAVTLETRGTSFERDGITPIYADVLDRVRRVPGVVAAGMSTRIPAVGGRSASFTFSVLGEKTPVEADREIDLTVVSPGYFAAAGAALVAGRDFDETDRVGRSPSAIVNDAFARRHFGGRSPIGGEVRIDG